jgi:hypothetical protein
MKSKGDKPIRVIIHIDMEMSQLNTPYSYLKQQFFFQNGEQEGKTIGPVWGLVPVGVRRI